MMTGPLRNSAPKSETFSAALMIQGEYVGGSFASGCFPRGPVTTRHESTVLFSLDAPTSHSHRQMLQVRQTFLSALAPRELPSTHMPEA